MECTQYARLLMRTFHCLQLTLIRIYQCFTLRLTPGQVVPTFAFPAHLSRELTRTSSRTLAPRCQQLFASVESRQSSSASLLQPYPLRFISLLWPLQWRLAT